MKILKCAFVFAFVALLAIACGEKPTANTAVKTETNAVVKTEPTAQADELAAARIHYSDKCSACHKENGAGGKVEIEGKTFKADDLTTEKMKKMDDAKYIKYIREGIAGEGMPAFADQLTDDEIKAVVKFIRKEIQKN